MKKLFSSLQNVILTIIFLSLITGMLFSGIALDFLTKKQFLNKTRNDFLIYTERSIHHLKNIEHKLALSTNNLTRDENLLSKISFISSYSGLNTIFDTEKHKLAQEAINFLKVTQFDHIRLYNRDGLLIAFSNNQVRNRNYGFLTYNNEQPEIVSFLPDKTPYYKIGLDTPYWKKYLNISDAMKDGVQYLEDSLGFNITYSKRLQTVYSNNHRETIGYIQVVKSINQDMFNHVAIDNTGFNLIISDSGKHLGPNPIQVSATFIKHSHELFQHKISDTREILLIKNYYITSHKIKLAQGGDLFLVFGANKNIINDQISQIRWVILAVFIIVTIISISISYIYFRNNTGQSIKKIISYADKIKSGHYDTQAPMIFEAELEHLTSVLQLAATTIQDREQELIKAQNMLEDRVKERTHELQLSKEEAEKANLAKSQFLSSMSHELRTPLNAILGFAQLLEMSALDEIHSSNTKEILQAGYHLLDLVNHILDLSRIEAGHLYLNFESLALTDVLPDCISQIEQSFSKTINVTIINKVSNSSFRLYADRVRLRQVLINLLSNAVKYNVENGTVTIEANVYENNQLCISIADTGLGISDEQIQKLFEPFERLNHKNGDIEGTGIGLTVTKQIITAMNGKIEVKSIPGNGSTFSVILPLDNNESAFANKSTGNKNEQQNVPNTEDNFHTLLYIEDNPANLKLVTQALSSRNDIITLTATNAEDGIAIAKEKTPDLILLDINLPGVDGFSALATLKRIDRTADIPVVAISANAMASDIEKSRQSGFSEYLTKPVDLNKLLETINHYLQ